MATVIFLSLGSNLGDRRANLRRALGHLRQRGVLIHAVSSFYQTDPVDVTEQPRFLNLVCRGTTALEPGRLLSLCQQVEETINPAPKRDKGPRHIDVDILFHGRQVISTPLLKIPHPAWRRRNFVLIPLQEIAPDFRDPVSGKALDAILGECPDEGRVEPLGGQSVNL